MSTKWSSLSSLSLVNATNSEVIQLVSIGILIPLTLGITITVIVVCFITNRKRTSKHRIVSLQYAYFVQTGPQLPVTMADNSIYEGVLYDQINNMRVTPLHCSSDPHDPPPTPPRQGTLHLAATSLTHLPSERCNEKPTHRLMTPPPTPHYITNTN